ncbi:MAG TPA: VanZ family protein [Gammaproteobacteria bacterium]|nr:VanZ family protein [Gammaproteobacteria bacterium]
MADTSVAARRLRSGWLILGICMTATVWWGCLTPSPPGIPPLFPQFDKFEHFFAYVVLAAWYAAIYASRRQWLVILSLLIVMGGAIEILQLYTGRDAEWLDWLADIAGVLFGLAWPSRWLRMLYLKLIHRYAEAT